MRMRRCNNTSGIRSRRIKRRSPGGDLFPIFPGGNNGCADGTLTPDQIMIGQKRYLRALVLLEWFALIAQFILQQQNSVTDRGESLITLGYSQVLINTLLLIF